MLAIAFGTYEEIDTMIKQQESGSEWYKSWYASYANGTYYIRGYARTDPTLIIIIIILLLPNKRSMKE